MRENPNVELAPFDAKLSNVLVPMWRASFEAGVGIVDPNPISDQMRYFEDVVLPHNDLRVALLDGALVGFVAATAESVSQLFVRVGFHRLGIGTRLLDWAKGQSAGSLWLYTFARNAGARAFYERRGFVAVAHGFEPTWKLDDVKFQWCAVSPAIGLAAGTVRLAPYDARWPALFEEEAAALRRLVPQCEIVHFGSTAVPGLEAKPVIDLMLGVPALRAPLTLFDMLGLAGYTHKPDDMVPGRLFFARDSGQLRTHNLSVCELGSAFWRAHVAFRDLLRSDADLATRYVALKRLLAARYPNDRIAYTDGKDEFIAAALAKSGFAGGRE